ncbi:MAG TPA: MBL fold metallo-hydrolase [Propionibacteriaceae bacterium]|nr:MBL fold metallo-hydrolase [Propionibacteriaceae bacterium]
MLIKNVADGVHLVSASFVNCYLLEDERGVTLVDTGLPGMWPELTSALAQLNHTLADLRAVVLTHAHFDHTGCAARVQQELDLPIYAHPDDHYIAAHPYRYRRQRPAIMYPLRYPRSIKILGAMARAGAFKVKGVSGLAPLTPNAVLDVPGRPRVVFSPGHTAGHCGLHLADRSTVITGDALVTLDPYTGFTGPQIVARAATADTPQALASLDALAATRAATVLPGHGEVWRAGIQAAVDHAKTHHTNE